ncbi:hypothetical protein EVAR_30091_1 [Eumeta japonica]|uniref:Uncharacterized protein n=1 Tax=Eumeta variegata TaxID=151549 RepID=A0A4C1XA86_EUMVA|nr:hypothetical protein EVAR_30091_1 [Eumeta japonica]
MGLPWTTLGEGYSGKPVPTEKKYDGRILSFEEEIIKGTDTNSKTSGLSTRVSVCKPREALFRVSKAGLVLFKECFKSEHPTGVPLVLRLLGVARATTPPHTHSREQSPTATAAVVQSSSEPLSLVRAEPDACLDQHPHAKILDRYRFLILRSASPALRQGFQFPHPIDQTCSETQIANGKGSRIESRDGAESKSKTGPSATSSMGRLGTKATGYGCDRAHISKTINWRRKVQGERGAARTSQASYSVVSVARTNQSDLSNYVAAYEDVKQGTSLRVASERHEVNRMSLLRYLRKRDKADEDEGTGSTVIMGHIAHNKVDIIS